MDDVRRMQMGQLVDFVITYNERQKQSETDEAGRLSKRRATQADIDAFFG